MNRTFFDYTPNDISSYRILEGGYYIAMPLPGAEDQTRFMEFLVDGKAKLYYLRDNSGVNSSWRIKGNSFL